MSAKAIPSSITRASVSNVFKSQPFFIFYVAVLIILGGLYAYWKMFTGFSFYDDDGYVELSLQRVIRGGALYDHVYSQYGPFYFLVYDVLHRLFRLPATHDAERLIGAALWLITSLLWARVAYLLTNSRLWSVAAFLTIVRLLRFFPFSAGHPQELCGLLVALLAVVVCGRKQELTSFTAATCAFLVTASLLVKVNLGIYLGLAIMLFFLKATEPTPLVRFVNRTCMLAALALPTILMAPFITSWAGQYALIATLNIGLCLFASGPVRPFFHIPARAWQTAGIVTLSSLVFIILPFLLTGTTLSALIDATLLQHIGVVKNWYIPTKFDAGTLALTAVSAIAFIVFRFREGSSERASLLQSNFGKYISIALRMLLIGAIVVGLWQGIIFLYFTTPFLGVFLLSGRREMQHSRVVIALIAAFTFLYAFPVAGAQVDFSSVPFAVIAIVLLQDAYEGVLSVMPARGVPRIRMWFEPFAFALIAVCLSLLAGLSYKRYTANVALQMPGAEKIRVAPEVRATYHWITRNVSSCASLYSMPGVFSLNLWTGKELPTDLAMSNWVGLLTLPQQEVVVRDLIRSPDLCIVYNPSNVEFWRRGQDLSKSPLANYIFREFVAVAESDGYSILRRTGKTGE